MADPTQFFSDPYPSTYSGPVVIRDYFSDNTRKVAEYFIKTFFLLFCVTLIGIGIYYLKWGFPEGRAALAMLSPIATGVLSIGMGSLGIIGLVVFQILQRTYLK